MANDFTNYNGQQVATSDWDKQRMQAGADMMSKSTGRTWTAQEYDKFLNPTTYGARWGVQDPSLGFGTGLLGSTPAKPAATATATTYEPTQQTVGEKSTVQNQLASLTGNGSALNTQAETAALKSANARGLLNSSIAVGAAQDAVLKNALPIAQQDANTYANADSANAQFRNSADQFNANARNVNSQFNAGQANQLTGQLIQSDTTLKNTDKDNAVKLQLQQLDADTRKALASMDEATKVKLQNLEAGDKQLLQTNISAANAYAQLAQALSAISTSTTMDAAGKQQATDNQINLFRQNLQALGQVSGLDLSKYFQQVSTSAQTGAEATNRSKAEEAVRGFVS